MNVDQCQPWASFTETFPKLKLFVAYFLRFIYFTLNRHYTQVAKVDMLCYGTAWHDISLFKSKDKQSRIDNRVSFERYIQIDFFNNILKKSIYILCLIR
jgi:hypothetical protein